MSKRLFICLLGLCACFNLQAQIPSINRYLDVQNDTLLISSMELLPDSGAILIFQKGASNGWDSLGLVLCRVDDDGLPLQTVSLKGLIPNQMTAQQTMINSSGELVILGRSQPVTPVQYFVLYIDPQTLTIRNLHYLKPDSSRFRLMQMEETTNGDLLIYGQWSDTTITTTLHHYPFVMRLNRQGTMLWQKTFRTATYNFGQFVSLRQYAPDRYMLISWNDLLTNPVAYQQIFWKMDGLGNVLATREFTFDGTLYDARMEQLQNGNMLVIGWLSQRIALGHSADDDNNSLLMEIDTSLNAVFVSKYDDFSTEEVVRETDSTLAIVAWNNFRSVIVRTDEQGNYLSARIISLPQGMVVTRESEMQLHPDGTYHLTQSLYDTAATSTFNDYLITDGSGTASCRSIDTTFSPAVSLSFSANAATMPDTSYSLLIDSFPIFVNPYPNPAPVLLCDNPCVWPGDANSDGIANLTDLLNVGVAFGTTGQARISVSNDWLCFASTDWPATFSNSLPYQHADCNGDGIVNSADTVAIQNNYGFSHTKRSAPLSITHTTDPGLVIVIPADSAFVGDTVLATILLGDSLSPVDSIYGIAFRINYDPALVDSGTFRLDFSSSWIGTPTQTLSLQQDNYSPGFIEGAIVRTDGNEISGYGELARISFVLIDNIEGKRQASETLPVEIGGYTAIDYMQNLFTFSIAHDSLAVQDTITSAGTPSNPQHLVKVFPNPFEDELNVRLEGARPSAFRLCDVAGRVLMEQPVRTYEFDIPLFSLSSGIYFLAIQTDKGLIRKKVFKK